MVDGEASQGRFVSHVSYAAYARAAQLEAANDLSGAEAAYQEALRYDPKSPQIWTRLGGVRCASKPKEADAAFETALRIDRDYAPLWYERARCSLEQGNLDAALEAAERALSLDPEHIRTSKLLAEILTALKRPDDAQRYLNALVARYPELGAQQANPSVERPDAGERSSAPNTPNQGHSTWEALDHALLDGDLKAARHHGMALELGLSELAARAALLGRADSALEQASELNSADPDNLGAWVTQLAAADLVRDEERFETVLTTPPSGAEPLDPSARLLFAELLKRRVGHAAARAFLEATRQAAAHTKAPPQALVHEHQDRLERELAGP